MIETFVRRPATTFIFVAIFMVMGLVSIGNLIIEATPKIEFPIVTVQTVYAGASPQEIETLIIKKIEDAISEISQIKSIKSDAKESVGVIVIEFLTEADVNIKSIEVKDKVEAIINDFPSGADRPIIAKFDPLVQPIATLVLTSEKQGEVELFEYADKILKTRLSAINGVASVDVTGGKERQINVYLDNNLLIQNYLSIQDVLDAIGRKNLNVPGGSIDRQESKINVRFVGEFAKVSDIEELEIVSKEGRVLKLKELGTVVDSFKDVEKIARYQEENVVALAVKKLSDGDAVRIVENLKNELQKVRTSLPEGMKLELAIDTTKATLSDTVSTIQSIGLGIILTIAILLTFLGDWRGAIIAAVVIPTSIISTFFLMDIAHFSINVMSLLAFGTCLGTLIANALIIIENVYKHLAMGKDSVTASVDGTKEVLLAVFGASGTNLVVFTPLAFMGGIVGQFMMQFGLTVVFATIFSIFASITLTPTLCALLLKDPAKLKGPFVRLARWMDGLIAWAVRGYRPIFDLMMKRPLVTIALGITLFLTVVYPAKRLGFEFVPKSDRDVFTVNIAMPDGTPIEKTTEVVKQIENEAKKYPEVESVLSDVGYDGEERARVTVNLLPLKERTRFVQELVDDLLPKVSNIPEAELSFLTSGSSGNGGQGDITLDITGQDFDAAILASEKIREMMGKMGNFSSIESSYRRPKMEVRFTPNPSAMIKQNLSNNQVGTVIRALVNGNDDAVYKENGEEYDINVTLEKTYKRSVEDFDQFLVLGKDGLIPISQLGKVEYTQATSPLKRRDKARIVQINGFLSKSTAGEVMPEIARQITELKLLPEGVNYRFTGAAENLNESSQEMGKAFLLAVILTYMLLVAILISFLFPISIGSAILTSFLGVFLSMFFLDQSMNIGSMMAIVMVVGLAVNNAILMIEFSQQRFAQGATMEEALWDGCADKLKPVLMTSIAIIAGTLPQLFDSNQIKSSMGAVVIGGMLGSMFFSYFMVPSIHLVVYRFIRFFSKSKKEALAAVSREEAVGGLSK
jgi:HAE1 family hydrophobic/amphiphilic exporter-1